MPELRKDPVAGRWVIIAVERAKRPEDFRGESVTATRAAACPFCPGNERLTPSEILALRDGTPKDAPGWRVRVVPNKFPALRVEGDLDKRGDGMYDVMNGIGAHEVVIENPDHVASLTALSDRGVGEVLWVYKQRLLDLKNDFRLVYGLVFKNVGERAGASLEHSHSQIIMTPIVPARVNSEIERSRQYYDWRGRCLFCDMIKQERASGTRIVYDTPDFIAFEPFAPRFPFETHVMPKRHLSHFEATEDRLIGELAPVLRGSLLKIERACSNPPYNYLIHTGPLNAGPMDAYHWHFEIIPRITRVAGFEWGTGFYINPVAPEGAAQYLREVRI